jgi:hypothetical protein
MNSSPESGSVKKRSRIVEIVSEKVDTSRYFRSPEKARPAVSGSKKPDMLSRQIRQEFTKSTSRKGLLDERRGK